MAIKHKIVINVSDPQGKTANVLKGANVKLPTTIQYLHSYEPKCIKNHLR